ncbi:MAG: hypothetical protein K0U45_03645 [Alphaproteobacteria bacterium]|nr:hypothetical protein [Alphaproteobacteria bacterium]
MAHSIIMPALGMTQNTGIIVLWHKKLGDKVTANDILLDVETDKSTMEVEAGYDGILASIKGAVNVPIDVGDVIALIAENDDEAQKIMTQNAEPPTNPLTNPATIAKPAIQPSMMAITKKRSPAKRPPAVAKAPSKNDAPTDDAPKNDARQQYDGKILISPKARKLAKTRGINVQQAVQKGLKMPIHVADIENLASATRYDNQLAVSACVTIQKLAELRNMVMAYNNQEIALSFIVAHIFCHCYRHMKGRENINVHVQTFGEQQNIDIVLDNPDLSGLADARVESKEQADIIVVDISQTSLNNMKPTHVEIPLLIMSAPKYHKSERAQHIRLTLWCYEQDLAMNQAIDLLEYINEMIDEPLLLLL